MNSTVPRQSHHRSLVGSCPHGFSLGLPVVFLAHFPFMATPSSWSLPYTMAFHSHSFTHCKRSLPVIPSLLLNSGQKLPFPHNSCIVHAYNTSIWMVTKSAVSSSTSLVALHHGSSSLLKPGCLRTVKCIMGKQFLK